MLFPHDFSKEGVLDFPSVKEKYEKRIARLYNLAHSQRVLFVYSSEELNQWQSKQYLLAECNYTVLEPEERVALLTEFKAIFSNSEICSLEDLKSFI